MKTLSIFVTIIAMLLTAQAAECSYIHYRALTQRGQLILDSTLTQMSLPQATNICFQKSVDFNNSLVPTVLPSQEALEEFKSPTSQLRRATYRTLWCAAKGGLYGSLGIIGLGCAIGSVTHSSVGTGAAMLGLYFGFTPGVILGGLIGAYKANFKPNFSYIYVPSDLLGEGQTNTQGIQFANLNKQFAKLGIDQVTELGSYPFATNKTWYRSKE